MTISLHCLPLHVCSRPLWGSSTTCPLLVPLSGFKRQDFVILFCLFTVPLCYSVSNPLLIHLPPQFLIPCFPQTLVTSTSCPLTLGYRKRFCLQVLPVRMCVCQLLSANTCLLVQCAASQGVFLQKNAEQLC